MKKLRPQLRGIQILNGIKNSDKGILLYIYETLFPVIQTYILANSGNKENAEDIFQEALLIIFTKLKNEDVFLSSSFKTYFYSICKNLWLNNLRKTKRYVYNHDFDTEYNNFDTILIPDFETEFSLIFFKHYRKLSKKSQQIIKFHFENVPAVKVAEKLGFKNKEYAISRKYKCLKRLITNIKNDPELNNINMVDAKIELFRNNLQVS